MPSREIQPAAWYALSGKWPDVEFAPDAPVEAVVARAVSKRLRDALAEKGWSARELARRADVGHATVNRLVAGEKSADMVTITRLEVALSLDLYPAGLWAQLAELSSGSSAAG
ncbi:helix-turn-helix domain-containing protein [Kitasatospora cheerisanensis]|uniref:HTH cro/C1-type domain-containing protein n=1 Tax=Kitasatospora cheerisanensis KCTC 2395 TaxID=1348663 RepID=A0A066Z5K1_9ACTN|nr:helix-turn-helix transcriptional regulator [Kitasatospora cheerisanensis]KDN85601.1 hypothetical protein KCH_26180 [Kitasatospora cheerisanensis KCTC 2395]